MPQKIAVTGASGHIGNVVCRELIKRGHEVRAQYHSDARALEGLSLELFQGTVLNKDDLAILLEGCDFVIHCAAIISINGDKSGIVFKTNTEGPANVLSVAIEKGLKKMVHVSSVHAVEDLPHHTPYDELRPYKKQGAFAYDFSKATGEQLVLNNSKNKDIEVVVVRPSCVVGPYDFKPSKMGGALYDFSRQKLPIVPHGGYDIVDVREVANSACNAIANGKNGEVYLLAGRYHSFKELVKIIHNIQGVSRPILVTPVWVLYLALPFAWLYSQIMGNDAVVTMESITAIRDGHPQMNHAKAKVELGHSPRPISETLSDLFEWIKFQRK
ncbi:MAG: NAD-dependent epimerase/dehydratase family protein [Flavobacteriales bacterium]|nr:NAD-dependent epimerase/dehydratase family protein [Flavobacteriales bacterium]